MTPAAVPESSICAHCPLASSALMMPPFDFRDHRLGRHAGRAQRVLQRAEVAADSRLHVAGDDGGHGTLVFADHRPHFAGADHRQVRRFARQDLADPRARGRNYGRRVAGRRRRPRRRPRGRRPAPAMTLASSRRRLDRAIGQHPLGNAEDFFASDQRRGRRENKSVRVRHLQAGEFEHVLEIRRREEAEIDALALDHRVDADRGAMGQVTMSPAAMP